MYYNNIHCTKIIFYSHVITKDRGDILIYFFMSYSSVMNYSMIYVSRSCAFIINVRSDDIIKN